MSVVTEPALVPEAAPSHDGASVWALSLDLRPGAPFGVVRPHAPRRESLDVRVAGRLVERGFLASQLGLSVGASDAEVVAAAYVRWGKRAFLRFRGAFVVVVIDRSAGTTTIARDQIGVQPVFYALAGRTCVVGDSPQRVLERAGLPRRLNRMALADALCRRYPDPEETFFDGVHRLPGGCLATLSRSGVRVERYWDPLPEDADIVWADASALSKFPALQRRAVHRCLDAGGDGIFLSGGLDSVSIAAVAADLAESTHAAPPVGLSLVQHDPSCNERDVQVAVAARLGMRHVLHDLRPASGAESLLAQSAAIIGRLSSPLLNVIAPSYLALASAGRRLGVRTILTGEGGDEWCSASPYGVADLLRRGRVFRAWRFAREYGRSEDRRGLVRHFGLRPMASSALRRVVGPAWDARRARRFIAGDPAWLVRDRSLRDAQLVRAGSALRASRPVHGFVAAELTAGLRGTLTSWEFEEQHDLGRHAGVRFVHPYMDVDLVAHMCRIPAHELNQDGWLRGMIRRPLASRFPDLGFDRQVKKLGQDFFQQLMWRDPLLDAIAREGFPALSALGVVDPARARAFVLERGSRPDPQLRTWDLWNTEVWARAQMQ